MNDRETACCGPDVTDWFRWEINLHTALFKQTLANEAAKLVVFGQYARRLAYKYLRFTVDDCPTEDCEGTAMLCGSCIHVSELGNIMFGAVGMVWFGREPVVVSGGIAASSSATGGIDSVSDMAGVLAGLQIGHAIRQQPGAPDLSRNVLCRQLKRLDTNLRDGLKDIFEDEVDQLIDGVGTNPLDTMEQETCGPCSERVAILAPHSDFGWIRSEKHMLRARTEWWETYDGMTSDGIDNSSIPDDL